ncbi:uncharacterized protein LOC111990931 [Quercus suber]|uniref:uncharacterized protein LOC111990931 n=1 Tax=Quercus suber TaxID=58331 RepID=UPI000CE26B50|nr:uncharacterized protein LOC111990931 [Quercus suber]POF23147.1 pectinesterase inhibitor [Quercus suber]
MAMKVGVSDLCLLVIPFVLSLLLSSHYFAKADNEIGKPLIIKTCTQTEFPDVCTSVLESDPRSSSANLTGLSRIGLELTATKVNETTAEAYKLLINATEYYQWSMRSACFYEYNSSVRQIYKGLEYFDQQKYHKANEVVFHVNGDIHTCSTRDVPELTGTNTLISKFTTDLQKILHQLY